VAERGLGKTTFLERLETRLTSMRVIRISAPDTFEETVRALAAELDIGGNGNGSDHDQGDDDEARVAEHIRASGRVAICVDDLQRMIMPAIGGLVELDRLVTYAREMGGDASWVFAVESPAWQYVRRARGESVFFDRVVELPKWSGAQIATLVRKRSAEAKVTPSFEGLVVPKNADGSVDDERAHKEEGFYGVLWDFSAGNPAVALHCFRESLFASTRGPDEPAVRLFREPPAEQIETLPGAMLFVLRAVLQLEFTGTEDIVRCTALPASDVADAIRLGLSRGYLERVPESERVQISFHWFRPLTSVLRRKHLLVG
jgi:hypothetical protein